MDNNNIKTITIKGENGRTEFYTSMDDEWIAAEILLMLRRGSSDANTNTPIQPTSGAVARPQEKLSSTAPPETCKAPAPQTSPTHLPIISPLQPPPPSKMPPPPPAASPPQPPSQIASTSFSQLPTVTQSVPPPPTQTATPRLSKAPVPSPAPLPSSQRPTSSQLQLAAPCLRIQPAPSKKPQPQVSRAVKTKGTNSSRMVFKKNREVLKEIIEFLTNPANKGKVYRAED